MKKIFLFLRTISDIGSKRIIERIIFEIKKNIFKIIPVKFSLFLIGFKDATSNFNKNLNGYYSLEIINNKNIKNKYIEFDFIGLTKTLEYPIKNWNNNHWPRLWQFNLHYFDWAKSLLDKSLVNGEVEDKLSLIGNIIDNWIEINIPGKGDGWDSYTISLRIRNWIWLFRCSPNLITNKRINSLWKQICWLDSHPEKCHGGNHFLENLIALIIGSYQFNSKKSKKIIQKSLIELKTELNSQIMVDGGHEERSAAYHFLLLERLVELGCVLRNNKILELKWLDKKIELMIIWAKKVKLLNNQLPSFNDSSLSLVSSPLDIIRFAEAYLNNSFYSKKGIKSLMIRESIVKNNTAKKSKIIKNPPKIIDLKNTGWTIFRPGNGWEITFKWGLTGPKHLPAHTQSDLLSLNIYKDGIPILIDAGTSTYENNSIRAYERSSAAHNCLQLGIKNNNQINWIEPVEVWNSFRAGFKAQSNGHLFRHNKRCISSSGSHDGYLRFGAAYERQVKCILNNSGNPIIKLTDTVKASKDMFWRQCWHFGSGNYKKVGKTLISQLEKNHSVKKIWSKTNYYLYFGKAIKRDTLMIDGFIKAGVNKFELILSLDKEFYNY